MRNRFKSVGTYILPRRNTVKIALQVAVLVLAVMFCSPVFAQAPGLATAPTTAPADTMESGWNVAVNGSFTSISGAPTNNGFVSGVSLRVAQHWNLRSDVYQLNSPEGMTLVLGGPEYRFSLAHLLGQTSFAANASKIEGFVNLGMGDAYTKAITVDTKGNTISTISASKLAASVGGGFDSTLTNNVTLRPLDVKYVRSSFLNGGGGFYGSQLDVAAGLGFRF